MPITENNLEVNSFKWFYRQAEPENEPENPPVLMLHGLPAHSFIWRNLMKSLASQGFRGIAPDWLGSGFSDKPYFRDFPYTPQAYLDGLTAFVDALEVDKIYLVVQGFLGHIGLSYALKNPDKIQGLVIINTPLTPTAKLPFTMQQWGWPLAGDMLTQDPLLVDRSLEKGSGFVVEDQDLAKFRKPYLQTSATGRALLTTVKKLNLPKVTAEIQSGFSNWENPTLIVWGMADPWLDGSDAENLAKSLPNAELVTYPEAQHYPQENWYEDMSLVIGSFLRRFS